MRVSITLPIPPMLNSQIRSARAHWRKSSKAKIYWTNTISYLVHGLTQFPSTVWLDFEWRVKHRGMDPDNVAASAKYIMDGLEKAGVIKKDSLMIIQSPVIHRYGKGENEVILTISDRPIYQLIPIEEESCNELTHCN